MKTAGDFWQIIGIYNKETIYIQVIFSLLIFGVLIISFTSQNRLIENSLKNIFSAAYIFIGIYFFLIIDKSLLQ